MSHPHPHPLPPAGEGRMIGRLTMRKATLYILSTTLALFFISGCAQPSRVDKSHGRSVKQALVNQILDPEAEKNLEPVTGLDGKAGQAGIDKYRKTFEQPHEGPRSSFQTGTQVMDRPIEGGGYGNGYSK